jgi:lipopolysaccharide-induced tumor necrosis factor-alpha factor
MQTSTSMKNSDQEPETPPPPPDYVSQQTIPQQRIAPPEQIFVQQPTQPIEQIPQQQVLVHRQTFASAVPLQALNQGPMPVDCPLCGVRAMTNVTYQVGSTTQFVPIRFAVNV